MINVLESLSRSYATSGKVAGKSPDGVIGYFSIFLILPAAV
jgi:hypothetical protein